MPKNGAKTGACAFSIVSCLSLLRGLSRRLQSGRGGAGRAGCVGRQREGPSSFPRVRRLGAGTRTRPHSSTTSLRRPTAAALPAISLREHFSFPFFHIRRTLSVAHTEFPRRLAGLLAREIVLPPSIQHLPFAVSPSSTRSSPPHSPPAAAPPTHALCTRAAADASIAPAFPPPRLFFGRFRLRSELASRKVCHRRPRRPRMHSKSYRTR